MRCAKNLVFRGLVPHDDKKAIGIDRTLTSTHCSKHENYRLSRTKVNQPSYSRRRNDYIPEEIRRTGISSHSKIQMAPNNSSPKYHETTQFLEESELAEKAKGKCTKHDVPYCSNQIGPLIVKNDLD